MRFRFNFIEPQLTQLIPGNKNVLEWYQALYKILPDYSIDTVPRVAAFISQCAHESGNFQFLTENLNYRAQSLMSTWPSRFSTMEIAQQYAMQPERIANRAYADRMGNGPESSGDGWRYAGKGLIQLTGRDNYTRFANSADLSLSEVPAYLTTYDGAVRSACWFWTDKNLNSLADAGDVVTISRRINGGDNGLEDRKKKYALAMSVLGGSSVVESNPTFNTNVVLRRGSRGPEVADMQARLGLAADGDFGPGTERAVREWQAANGLEADGIGGTATLSKLMG